MAGNGGTARATAALIDTVSERGASAIAGLHPQHRSATANRDVTAEHERPLISQHVEDTGAGQGQRRRQEEEDDITVDTGTYEASPPVAGPIVGAISSGVVCSAGTNNVPSVNGRGGSQYLAEIGRPLSPNPYLDQPAVPATSSAAETRIPPANSLSPGCPPPGVWSSAPTTWREGGNVATSPHGLPQPAPRASVTAWAAAPLPLADVDRPEPGNVSGSFSDATHGIDSRETKTNNNNNNGESANLFPVPSTPRPLDRQQHLAPSVGYGECRGVPSSHEVIVCSGLSTPAAAASESEHGTAEIFKTATPRRRRVVKLDDGSAVVLPTNIYKQSGGVKLDLSLGGLRINGDKVTMKNRAFNFGVLHGVTRENILALRAFRNAIIPSERSTANTVHIVTAAEALRRYDEEHIKPSTASEPGSSEGATGWIPDSEEVHLTVVGSHAELRIKASELRAVDRPAVCKRALEVLRSDLDVLAGQLEPAPEAPMVDSKEVDFGTEGASLRGGGGGLEDGGGGRDNGRSSLVPICPASADRAVRVIMPPIQGFPEIIGGVGVGQHPVVSVPGASETGMPKRRRRKKKAVVAEDGNIYDLPTYVQNVENKKERSTLRLKMPLSGFLVRGEDISVADLVVACGLDVTRRNLLALRGARDAVMKNFAGPPAVQRLVAAEVFHVWYKRKYSTASASAESSFNTSTADADAAATPKPTTVETTTTSCEVTHQSAPEKQAGTDGEEEEEEEEEEEDDKEDDSKFPQSSLSERASLKKMDVDVDVDSTGKQTGSTTATASASVSANASASASGSTSVREDDGSSATAKSTATVKSTSKADYGVATANSNVSTSGRDYCATATCSTSAGESDAKATATAEAPSNTDSAGTPRAESTGTPVADECSSKPPAKSNSYPSAVATAPATSESHERALSGARADLPDDHIIIIAGPPSGPGLNRIELQMSVGDLKAARTQRTRVFKHLVTTMLNDPVVQAGNLDMATQQSIADSLRSSTPLAGAAAAMALLAKGRNQVNQSGAAAIGHASENATPAAVGAASPAMSSNGNGRTTVAGAVEQIRDGGDGVDSAGQSTAGQSAADPAPRSQFDRRDSVDWSEPGGGAGGEEGDGKDGVAWDPALGRGDRCGNSVKREREQEATDERQDRRGKRVSHVVGESDVGGSNNRGAEGMGAGQGQGEGVSAVDSERAGTRDPPGAELASNSKRRRQIWMREIEANERRYERRKEEARRDFEARQQQLLRWMVEEEAGRHDALDGNAGPPPYDGAELGEVGWS